MKVAVSIALSALPIAEAATPPPPMGPDDVAGFHRATVQPVMSIWFGKVQVVLESTAFSDVEQLGFSPIGQHGDAGGFEMWRCYTLTDLGQRVWLTSSELGGHKYITGVVAVVLRSPASASNDCPPMATEFRPVHLDSGVWLGATLGSLSGMVEEALHPGAETLGLYYEGKAGAYDVGSSLFLKFRDDKIVGLDAHRTTTN